MSRILNVAVLGCGRMGRRHALNVAYRTPRAALSAVVDVAPSTEDWARSSLPPSSLIHADPSRVFEDDTIDAVVIATDTASHASLTLQALQAGKHVLLEKPIAIDLADTIPVVEAARARPDLKTMVGLSRRFDENYMQAKAAIAAGQLGDVYMLKSATNDQYDPTGFFVRFSKLSGGIFMDCGIHDIDMSRWLLDVANPAKLRNPKKQVTKVYATGTTVRHPELAETRDVDNGLAIVDYENGTQLSFHVSRTATHGHECFTEVFGTDSQLIINRNPAMNRTEIRDLAGVRMLSTPTYYERFREAFVTEINEFTACVLDDKPVPVTCEDAFEAGKIATALTESLRTGSPVYFDEEGSPITTGAKSGLQ